MEADQPSEPPANQKPGQSSDLPTTEKSGRSSPRPPDLPTGLPPDWYERFQQGIAEFNQGKFYDCHETLERCWQEQGLLAVPMTDPHREWVQGIIQIAVGFHHLERDNVKGALKLFNRGLARIMKFPLITYPLKSGPLEAVVKSTIDELTALGEPASGQVKMPCPKIEHK